MGHQPLSLVLVDSPKASGTTDLRHYFASLLIASGADVKTVQTRLRHTSAKTTLDTYGHLWPDRDESTRAAVEAVLSERGAISQGAQAEHKAGAQ